jgi:hydrogenase maturation protein HypF
MTPRRVSLRDVRARGASDTSTASISARMLVVHGVVQGVGFRPFVWRLAFRYGLSGWVRNREGDVEILAEGPEASLEAFRSALAVEAPPLAQVEDVQWSRQEPLHLSGFAVEDSAEDEPERNGAPLVSPDVATCAACLRELFDPADRRYRYPFINCTDCGPRFTIIDALPYDRARTSMQAFPMCPDCAREYEDPADRRFHAEPVACPACGPHLSLHDSPGGGPHPGDPILEAAAMLRDGSIVAVKGLGGFHLACDATHEPAVAELRKRKHRPDKPFAVMVATLLEADEYFDPTPQEEGALTSWRAPIVLIRDRGRLAPSVAPGHRRQGAMLPSTPLHHLLLRAAGRPLVMTSGNRSDEPICIDDEEARRRLSSIADAFLVHDREIVARYDDSVTAWHGGSPVVIRRARSFAPASLRLESEVRPVLGTGAELHGAFCLAKGPRAFLSQHIGDLDSDEAMASYAAALERYRDLFRIEPEAVAHDLHPDFLTTRFAQSLGLPTVPVQHHHAHIAAVMAEHALEGRVIGVAYDGFGLGDDGTAWGGEFLVCDPASAERVGHLRYVPQPGGDAAVRNPSRMALAHASDAGVLKEALRLLGTDRSHAKVILAQIESGLNSPPTSSAGRLFDAVAALAGICSRATYEGHPAILLEQAADGSATFEYPFDLGVEAGRVVLDSRPIVAAVVKDLVKGRTAGEVAGRFHRTMAAGTLAVCRLLRGQTGLNRVCLGGGVFQNDLLTSDLAARLASCDFEVFVPREVPVGDGGIALGQVLVAHGRGVA